MYEILIIGGGPAGLPAAIYASRAGVKPLVLESLTCGGQVITTSEIENYPAITKIEGWRFADEEPPEKAGLLIEELVRRYCLSCQALTATAPQAMPGDHGTASRLWRGRSWKKAQAERSAWEGKLKDYLKKPKNTAKKMAGKKK